MKHVNSLYNPSLTRINAGRTPSIFRNRTRRHSRLITPPPVIIPSNPIAFPRPKHPAGRFLKGKNLGGPEFLVPLGLVGAVADAELVVVLDGVGDGDGPLADDDAVLAVVAAGSVEVAVFCGSDACVPFEVAVVVKGGEIGAGEGTCWVSRTPGGILLIPPNISGYFITTQSIEKYRLQEGRVANHELDM